MHHYAIIFFKFWKLKKNLAINTSSLNSKNSPKMISASDTLGIDEMSTVLIKFS